MSTEPLDIKFIQRFPINFLSNIIYFILNIIIGLLLVPFFMDTLGIAAYGLIPLATSITSYVTLVIDSSNTSISRFLTIDLQRKDIKRANETFNTALFGTLGVIFLLMPFAIGAAWYAPVFFKIGEQSATDVFWLFALIFGSVLIRAWSGTFMAILFAHNRLELRNFVNISNQTLQLVLVVSFFLYIGPSLVLVGLSYIGAAIVSSVIAVILSKKTSSNLKISLASFTQSRLLEIGGMSVWVLINSIGFLLNTQVALILVNKLFGEVAGSEYSLVAIWSTLLIGIVSLVTDLFTPKTYSYYAKQDREGLTDFTSLTVKFVGLFMALPIGLVCIFSAQILTFWVGSKFAHLAPLIWICITPVILVAMVSCISPITVAYNRVRSLVILTLPMGFLNVILALVLPSIFGIGIYGIALAGFITLFLRYGVINPIFIASIIQIPKFTYVKLMLYGIGGLFLLSILGITIVSMVDISTIINLILMGCGIAMVYLLVLRYGILNHKDREMIRSSLPRVCQMKIPKWLL